MKKPKKPVFDVWVKRTHTFTAKVEADSLTEAIEIAEGMSIDQLIDAPGETN